MLQHKLCDCVVIIVLFQLCFSAVSVLLSAVCMALSVMSPLECFSLHIEHKQVANKVPQILNVETQRLSLLCQEFLRLFVDFLSLFLSYSLVSSLFLPFLLSLWCCVCRNTKRLPITETGRCLTLSGLRTGMRSTS